MTTFLIVIWLLTLGTLAAYYVLKQRADKAAQKARQEAESAREESRQAIVRGRAESEAAVVYAGRTLQAKLQELAADAERVREYYATESLRVYGETTQRLEAALAELAPLRAYAGLADAEGEVRQVLAAALQEGAALQREAQMLLDHTKQATIQERAASQEQMRALRAEADSLLIQATRDAARIVESAEKKAEHIGGEAYLALRDKQVIEDAVGALWNVVEGYGDRYVVPTRSLLDDLAADFGHTEAGEQLRVAREQTRRLVELRLAASCKYEEEDRRDRANRFIVDAFNGRVDAILSRTKHDNFGTLAREIQDAFSIVNLNGLVFREARILPVYLEARLAELKWAAVVQELRMKEREQQRAIQERIREEEKARREYERARQEAAREEAAIKQAMIKARAEAEHAGAAERAKLEAELSELSKRLGEAEARGLRALSMAQQTRTGNVYVISNVGSFGEDVLKIGMTRRLIPEDRIRELGDASVPFSFDVHAMIKSDDAPTLERMLHQAFNDARINKVNYRKEFFRMPLERLRTFAEQNGMDVTFTLAAEAREYRETLALAKMPPQEREKFHQRREVEEEGDASEDESVSEQVSNL